MNLNINIGRGIKGGGFVALLFLIPVLAIVIWTLFSWEMNGTQPVDRRFDVWWWRLRVFPGIVVIPMLLFFSGFANFALKTDRRLGLAKSLLVMTLTSLPVAAILGSLGMAHPRYKSIEHPPMYLSEIAMFLVPMVVVAAIIILVRSQKPVNDSTGSNVDADTHGIVG